MRMYSTFLKYTLAILLLNSAALAFSATGTNDLFASATTSPLMMNSDSIEVFARALCDPDERGTYMVQVDSVRRTTSGRVASDVTIAGVTQTVAMTGPGVTFGPFTHSGVGNGVQVGVAENGLDSCIFTVVEALCGYGNDTVYCDCSVSNTFNLPAGVIVAQSQPGSFQSGGNTGFIQKYILVDNATQTIVEVNELGMFTGLENGTYQVYALNYPVDEAPFIDPFLTAGQDIDVFIDGLANSGALMDACFDLCGPAEYELTCTSPTLNPVTLMECPKVINGMQGLFTLDDALNATAPSNMNSTSIIPTGFEGIVTYHLDSLSAVQGVAALPDSNYLSLNGSIWARFKDTTQMMPLVGHCCASLVEIELMVKTSPVVADTMLMACESSLGNGMASIELPSEISELTVTSYYPTLLMAADSMAAGLAAGTYTLIDTTLYARVIDDAGCPAVSEVTISIKDIPIVSTISPIEVCPNTTIPTVSLFSTPSDPLNTTFSYRVIDADDVINLADNATGTVGPVANPQLPTITTTANIGMATIRVVAEQNGCLGDSIDITITTNTGFGITFIGCPIATIMKPTDPDSCGAIVEWTPPTAISDCNTPLTPVRDMNIGSGLSSGDQFPTGSDTIRYIVNDGSGNMDTCEFYIMVMDAQDPVVNCPADTILFADNDCEVALDIDPLVDLNENCAADTSYTVTFADGTQETGDGLPGSQDYKVGLNTVCIQLTESGDRMTPSTCTGAPGGLATLTYDFQSNSLAGVPSNAMLVNGLDYSASGDVGPITFSSGNPTPSASTNGWSNSSSFVASEYTELIIVAPACFDLTVSSITFDTRRSGTGPQQMGISIDGSASLDFTDPVPSGSSFSPHTYNPTSTLTIPAGTMQSVRFHGWATSNSSGLGTFRLDNIIVSVTAAPIPSMPVTSSPGVTTECCFSITVVDTIKPEISCPPDLLNLSCGDDIPAPLLSAADFLGGGGMTLLSEDFSSGTSSSAPTGWTTSILSGGGGDDGIDACGSSLFSFDCTNPSDFSGPANSSFMGQIGVINDDDATSLFQGEAAILSPVVDLSGITDPLSLSYDYSFNETGGSMVRVEAFNGSTWDVLTTYTSDIASSEALDLSAYSNADFQIRFTHDDNGSWAWGFGFDNVLIESVSGGMLSDNCTDVEDLDILAADFDNGLDICDGREVRRVYTVIDAQGNVDSCTQLFRYQADETSPVLVAAQNDTVACGANSSIAFSSWLNTNGGATATDDCSPTITWSSAILGSGSDCDSGLDSTLVRFYAMDACGNTDSTDAAFYLIDTLPPIWTILPQNLIISCDTSAIQDSMIQSWLASAGNAVFSDACSDSITVTNSGIELNGDCGLNTGIDTVTFYIEDVCVGNIDSATAIIQIIDDTPPVVILPPKDTFIDCVASQPDMDAALQSWLDNYGGMIAGDGCSGLDSIAVFAMDTVVDCGSSITQRYMFQAVDSCGNMSPQYFASFSNRDTIPPTFTCPMDVTVNECSGIVPNVLDGITGQDNCSDASEITFSQSPVPGVAFGNMSGDSLFVVVTATDACGNSDTCHVEITIDDEGDPVFVNCPDTIRVCNDIDQCMAKVNWLDPIAVDNCDDTLQVVQTVGDSSGAFFPIGRTDITYTATDDDGNSVECNFVIEVMDCQNPTAVCKDINIYLDASGMATITAADIDGGSNDNCGIQSIVSRTLDFSCTGGATPTPTENLIITGAYDGPLTGGTPKGVELYAQTDIADLSIFGLGSANNGGGTDGEEFTFPAVSVTAGTYIYVSSESAQFNNFFGFMPDYTSTSMSINGDDAIELFKNGAVVDVFGDINTDGSGQPWDYLDGWAYRMDNTGPSTSFNVADWTFSGINVFDGTSTNAGASPAFPIGTFTAAAPPMMQVGGLGLNHVTLVVTDNSGNVDSCIANVTVIDTIAPMFTCPSDMTVSGCSGTVPDLVVGLTGTDNCSGTVTFTQNPLPGVTFGPNANDSLFVVITATDASGNVDTCSVKVTIIDSDDPYFQNCPSDLTVCADIDECSAIVNFSTPVAFDNCDDSLTVTQTRGMASGSAFIVGMPDTIEFTATDDDGNDITCSFIINVEDCQAPDAVCQDIEIYLDASGAATIVASDIDGGSDDNCSLDMLTSSQTSFDCSHIGLNQVTLTVSDTSGNVDSCVATVTVVDTIAPMFTCPSDMTVSGCSGTIPDLVAGLTGTDNCSGTVTFTQNPLPGVTFGPNANDSLFVVITATDASGNVDTCSVKVTIIDSDDPYFQNCPSDLTVCADVDECSAIVNFSTPVAFDNCDDSLTVTQTRGMVSGSAFIVGMPDTIEFTAIDDDGNDITCSFIINVEDCQAPDAVCQDIEIYLDGSGAATIVASDIDGGSDDNCSLDMLIASQTSFDCSHIGLNQVTLTVSDTSGNVDSCVATVTVVDTIAPMFTCPSDLTVGGCSGTVPDFVTGLAGTGTDNCSGTVTFTQNPLPGVTFGPNANDSLFVVITATDASGNVDTCSVKVTIIDSDDPYFQNCPGDLTVCADVDECSAIVNFSTPVAFDNCDDSLMVTQTRGMVSGSAFIVGMPDTIEFTATDDDGNVITCSFIINVEDCQAPDAVCQDIEIYLDASGAATIVASDIDGGSDDNCSLDMLTASQTSFDCSHIGLNQVTLTVSDTSGNVDSCVATVTVVDTIAPMFTCPSDVTVSGCSGTVPDFVTGLAGTGTDNCAGTVTFAQSPLPGVTFGPNANDSINVIITATDVNGNVDTCSVKVTIIDNGLPVFTNCPDTIMVCNDADLCGAKVNWFDPTAVDNCDDTLAVVQTGGDPSGSLFPFGTTNITYTATDDNGNTVTCEFVIMVMDCQIPTPICKDIEVYLDATGTATIVASDIDGGSHDNCDTVELSISQSQFDCSNLGLNNITLTVSDTLGNSDSCVATVTVIDTIAPTFTCPADVSVGGCSGTIPNLISGLIGNDNCGGPVTFDQNPLPGVTFGPNANDSVFVTITATDASGNTDSCQVKVTIVDDGVPVFVNCPDTISLCNDINQCGANANWFLPIAVDNCDDTLAVTLTAGLPSGSFFPVGATNIEYTATDDDGNSSTCEFVVVVSDCEAPTAVCKDIFLNVDGNCEVTIMADAVDGGSTDNCAIDTMLISRDGSTFTDMITFMVADLADPFVHVTLQVTDIYGNVSECVATATILDTMAPNIICQDDITINSEPGTCYGKLPNVIPPLDTMENCLPLAYFDQYPEPGLLFGSHHGDSLEVFVVATDMDGNKDTCSLFVHLNDNEPPMFTNCPRPQIIVKAMPGMCGAFVNFSLPVATDNCHIDTTYQSDNTGLTSGDMFPAGKTILEWVTFDLAGNMDSCTVEIIVNDEQDPTIECPDDITVVSDPGVCGAQVDSGLSVVVTDNCLTAVTYQVVGENGETISTGVENADGSEFGCGVNTVNYAVSDQPILLITEVTQDISAVIGGTTPLPSFIQPTAGNDYIEITNIGPADYDLSCLQVERLYAGGHDTLEVPARTILPVGEVLTVHFGTGVNDAANFFFNDMDAVDVPTATPAAYIISFAGRIIDLVAVNGFDPTSVIGIAPVSSADWDISASLDISSNGGASRISVWDTNSADDFRRNDACHIGTVGTLNPELPTMASNGSVVALQTLAENTASCSFTVTIADEELPHCGSVESHVYTGGTNNGDNIVGGSVVMSSFNVTDNFLIADVNVLNIDGTHPDVGDLVFKLKAPSGTEIILGSNLCNMSADFDFGLDSDSTIAISAAPCAPLGQGGLFIPEESLDAFVGELSFGTWTLSIADQRPANSGVFNSWTLELMSQEPYAQQDTTIENTAGECSGLFTWTNPELFDNCQTGQMTVSYETLDDISLPLGGTVTPGAVMTETFGVGVTTVIYTLTDKMGNESSCSFDITVLDTEAPVVACPDDIIIALSSGDCDGVVYFDLNAEDNCEIDSFLATPASGSSFPIGVNTVEVIAFDVSGNTDTCYFTVEVLPFDPQTFDLTCKGKVNLSLGPDCEAAITADMLLVGDNHTCYEDYCVSVEDTLGNAIPDTVFNLSHVGNCYNVSIFLCDDPSVTCWGVICVEKKSTPDFICPADTILPCNVFADTSVTGTPYITSCETGYNVTYDDTYQEFDICDSIVRVITREWTVTNDQGFSNTCTQTIEIRKFNLDMVQFPPDFIGNLAFECSDVANDPSLTTTDNTGIPTIDNKGIFGDHYCEVDVGYWDEHLTDANCPSAYTILRNWIVLDECLPTSATNPRRHIQRIKVADKLAPETICPDDITISTDAHVCYGSTILELPTVNDGCSEITDTKIEVSSGALYQIGPDEWILSNLIEGTHTVTFRVTDGCRNRTTCSYNITVVDDVAPTPSCDQTTRVSLGTDGLAYVCWETFDDFGYDNCGIETIQVRRVERGNCAGFDANDRTWKDCEEFCCDDIDEDVLIEVGYWDYSGNFNYCWVTVIVEDKLPPAIVAPPDITISCDFKFDLNNLDIFGKVASEVDYVVGSDFTVLRTDNDLREDIIIDDQAYYECLYGSGYTGDRDPINWGIDGWAVDNCSIELTYTDNIDMECGRSREINGVYLPAITRRWTATPKGDPHGNGTQTAVQRIYIKDCDPFFICDTESKCAPLSSICGQTGHTLADDVEWPCDIFIQDCPANVDYPTPYELANNPAYASYASNAYPDYIDDKCSIVADSFVDEVFEVEDACYKILRHWSIIDWCQYDENTGEGRWNYTQVLKVTDNEAPVISMTGPGCDSAATDCYSSVNLVPTVMDCTPHDQLVFWWRLDVDNDGDFDYEGTTEDPSDVIPALPYGNHRILWVIEDRCGNKATKEIEFETQDCKKPSPVCINGLSSVVMPATGEIEIWAVDWDASSFDNCDTMLDFRIWWPGMDSSAYTYGSYTRPNSLSSGLDVLNNLPSSAFFNCEFMNNQQSATFTVEIYAVDDHGNWDFCTSYITITDPSNVCYSTVGPIVSGVVLDKLNQPIELSEVTLTPEQTPSRMKLVNEQGQYAFNVISGETYSLDAVRNDDHLNGVTAQDLAVIQRHIAHIEHMDNDYDRLAADANRDGKINVLDILALRKLLLGDYNELPSNTSWVMIPARYTFPGMTVLKLPEDIYDNTSINLFDVTTTQAGNDFVGVKIGDVDGDAIPNSSVSGQDRNDSEPLKLRIENQSFDAGQIIEVPVTSDNINEVTAYQTTFGFNSNKLEFMGIEEGVVSSSDLGFGDKYLERGLLSHVFYPAEKQPIVAGSVLYTIRFKARESGQLSGNISIGSEVTKSLAFTSAERIDVELDVLDTRGIQTSFALYQNTPNPFKGYTTISYNLPKDTEVTISIFDAEGALLSQIAEERRAGYNEFLVNSKDLNSAGVYFYEVKTDNNQAMKRMILIE